MKKFANQLYDARMWLTVLVILSAFFIYLAWLAYPETFYILVGLMVVFSIVVALLPIFVSVRHNAKVEDAFHQFIIEPDEEHEDALCQLLPKVQQPLMRQIGKILREKEDRLTHHSIAVADYENYIEEWVHEIKKPLSLLTLVLDNRQEEMTPLVQQRVTHARNDIQSDVEKILYFSRLRTVHRDYLFEPLDLQAICQEAVTDHRSILDEANVQIRWSGQSQTVVSDRKSLLFVLSQLIQNSAKYAAHPPATVQFEVQSQEQVVLHVQDNGPGVATGDLPFLFDKGFTGGKAKATGMGLHLVKRLADDLNITVKANSLPGFGLRISLIFPKVTKPSTMKVLNQGSVET